MDTSLAVEKVGGVRAGGSNGEKAKAVGKQSLEAEALSRQQKSYLCTVWVSKLQVL